ncbi:MAG TPA: ABC transporter permease [Caulobacteraceae bacterium]|jgi:ABC-2 type transport system permease protein|nr:ABC transporter permease [Caulobacteraceae bacterium]
MNRLLKIAFRDYIAYVRTPGFWLSILLMPIGLITFGWAPLLVSQSEPVANLAVVDFSGQGYVDQVGRYLAPTYPGQKPIARLVAAPGGPFADPAAAAAALKPYVAGTRALPGGGQLEAAAIIKPSGSSADIDYWSRNVSDRSGEMAVGEAVSQAMRRASLAKAGIGPAALASADALSPRLTAYSAKIGGKASQREKVRSFAGVGMGFLLWMVVFTGAGMLLNSVIEEKSSRILEVLLTSASVPQIMGGKILGVACVTATVLGVWLTLGGVALSITAPSIAADLGSVLFNEGMIAYLALYFIGGYLMFATLYVTVGAFCETTREAQTLLGPMMILLSLPMVFMTQAIAHPDSPVLATLSWVPVFTPFMMAARAASDPPLWQIAGTGALMLATTALELWVAGPAFKSGALSTGRFELRTFFASLARRTGE